MTIDSDRARCTFTQGAPEQALAEHLAIEGIDSEVMREFIPWHRDYYASFKCCEKR